jgi:excisionase family DNA binding protein
MNEPWVTVDEVAQHLGVARDSVYRWIEAKGLPAHRIGRLWKFRISEVDVWVLAGGAGEHGAEPVRRANPAAKRRRGR